MSVELLAVPGSGTRLEADMVAFEFILARERLQESHAAAQFRQARQAALQLARRQVMQHIRADQQVDRRAGAQLGEIAETGVVQVAPRTMFRDREFAAVET